MKKRWRILIAVVVVLVLATTIHHVYYSIQFKRRVQALADEGAPISFSDLDEMDALPPGVPNAADFYLQAFEYYQKPDKTLKPYLPHHGGYVMDENKSLLPDEVMNAIAIFLEANAQTLALLDQGALIEHCVYPRERPLNMDKQDLFVNIKNCGWLLSGRILYLAQTHQTEKLSAAIHSLLKFAESPIRQGILVDEMIAAAMKVLAVNSLEYALSQVIFTNAELANLQQQFYDIQDLEAGYRGFIKDRIYFLISVLSPFDERFEPPTHLNRWRERVYSVLGLMQKEYVMHLDYFERCIDAAQLPLHERTHKFGEIHMDFAEDVSRWQIYIFSISANMKCAEIDMRVIGRLRCAEMALAIERYRLARGEVPGSLEDLVPEFMEAVPLEPFDGEPLRYIRHEEGGYTLYCIGDDWVDNGGLSKEQMAEQTGEADPEEYDWPFTVKRLK